MSGAEDLIVVLWFLPVTVFIIIPLMIGFAWSLISIFRYVVKKMSISKPVPEEQEPLPTAAPNPL
ncbi:MAG TPA: hypothetical protein DDX99_15085 [Desulfofustis sp.]|jgi:hypothetical protein|nr:hypothetical protein [Desulfofustis sp. PB-SRB1]HBH30134.1 hypothetical protein [Desulfofustis sp.]HBH32564.1 hypothetical protein [Desulfofustis sp.]